MRLLALFLVLGCSYPLRAGARSTEPASLSLGEITGTSVKPLEAVLEAAPPQVFIVIDSPGGSVQAGLELVDYMRYAQRRGTQITCLVDGWAASMAGYVLAACDVRLMTKQSALMYHTVSVPFAPGGNQWDFERLVQRMRDLNRMLAIFIVGRLEGVSIAQFEARVKDWDWWVGHEEALRIGAVDGVL